MYFIMKEDHGIKNRFQFEDIKIRTYIGFKPEEIKDVKDISVLFVSGDKDSVYPDFIDAPFHMVSDRLKLLMEPYDLTVSFKKVVLIHNSRSMQSIYWLIFPQQRDFLHKKTERYPNGLVKTLVLDKTKVKQNRILQVNILPVPRLVIHLDVSEAILRRNMTGLQMEWTADE